MNEEPVPVNIQEHATSQLPILTNITTPIEPPVQSISSISSYLSSPSSALEYASSGRASSSYTDASEDPKSTSHVADRVDDSLIRQLMASASPISSTRLPEAPKEPTPEEKAILAQKIESDARRANLNNIIAAAESATKANGSAATPQQMEAITDSLAAAAKNAVVSQRREVEERFERLKQKRIALANGQAANVIAIADHAKTTQTSLLPTVLPTLIPKETNKEILQAPPPLILPEPAPVASPVAPTIPGPISDFQKSVDIERLALQETFERARAGNLEAIARHSAKLRADAEAHAKLKQEEFERQDAESRERVAALRRQRAEAEAATKARIKASLDHATAIMPKMSEQDTHSQSAIVHAAPLPLLPVSFPHIQIQPAPESAPIPSLGLPDHIKRMSELLQAASVERPKPTASSAALAAALSTPTSISSSSSLVSESSGTSNSAVAPMSGEDLAASLIASAIKKAMATPEPIAKNAPKDETVQSPIKVIEQPAPTLNKPDFSTADMESSLILALSTSTKKPDGRKSEEEHSEIEPADDAPIIPATLTSPPPVASPSVEPVAPVDSPKLSHRIELSDNSDNFAAPAAEARKITAALAAAQLAEAKAAADLRALLERKEAEAREEEKQRDLSARAAEAEREIKEAEEAVARIEAARLSRLARDQAAQISASEKANALAAEARAAELALKVELANAAALEAAEAAKAAATAVLLPLSPSRPSSSSPLPSPPPPSSSSISASIQSEQVPNITDATRIESDAHVDNTNSAQTEIRTNDTIEDLQKDIELLLKQERARAEVENAQIIHSSAPATTVLETPTATPELNAIPPFSPKKGEIKETLVAAQQPSLTVLPLAAPTQKITLHDFLVKSAAASHSPMDRSQAVQQQQQQQQHAQQSSRLDLTMSDSAVAKRSTNISISGGSSSTSAIPQATGGTSSYVSLPVSTTTSASAPTVSFEQKSSASPSSPSSASSLTVQSASPKTLSNSNPAATFVSVVDEHIRQATTAATSMISTTFAHMKEEAAHTLEVQAHAQALGSAALQAQQIHAAALREQAEALQAQASFAAKSLERINEALKEADAETELKALQARKIEEKLALLREQQRSEEIRLQTLVSAADKTAETVRASMSRLEHTSNEILNSTSASEQRAISAASAAAQAASVAAAAAAAATIHQGPSIQRSPVLNSVPPSASPDHSPSSHSSKKHRNRPWEEEGVPDVRDSVEKGASESVAATSPLKPSQTQAEPGIDADVPAPKKGRDDLSATAGTIASPQSANKEEAAVAFSPGSLSTKESSSNSKPRSATKRISSLIGNTTTFSSPSSSSSTSNSAIASVLSPNTLAATQFEEHFAAMLEQASLHFAAASEKLAAAQPPPPPPPPAMNKSNSDSKTKNENEASRINAEIARINPLMSNQEVLSALETPAIQSLLSEAATTAGTSPRSIARAIMEAMAAPVSSVQKKSDESDRSSSRKEHAVEKSDIDSLILSEFNALVEATGSVEAATEILKLGLESDTVTPSSSNSSLTKERRAVSSAAPTTSSTLPSHRTARTASRGLNRPISHLEQGPSSSASSSRQRQRSSSHAVAPVAAPGAFSSPYGSYSSSRSRSRNNEMARSMMGVAEQTLPSASQPPPPPPLSTGGLLGKFAVVSSVKTISPKSSLLAPTAAHLSRQSEVKRDHFHRHLVNEDHEAVSRRGIMPRTVSPDQAMRRDATVAYAQHQRAQAVMSARSTEDPQRQFINEAWGKALPTPNLMRQQLERAPPPPLRTPQQSLPPPPQAPEAQFVVTSRKPQVVLGM
jgi:hypothetical protein